jgi:chromate transporter
MPDPSSPGRAITIGALFWGFCRVALRGFGGVLPWARRMLVEEEGWLTPEEFTEALSLCQVLPGPNVGNLSIVVGARFRGVPGALAAFGGLMLLPTAIALGLGAIYARVGHSPAVDGMFRALAAAGAGLVIATGLRMSAPLRARPWALAVLGLAFVTVALLRWPLLLALVALVPLSFFLARWANR